MVIRSLRCPKDFLPLFLRSSSKCHIKWDQFARQLRLCITKVLRHISCNFVYLSASSIVSSSTPLLVSRYHQLNPFPNPTQYLTLAFTFYRSTFYSNIIDSIIGKMGCGLSPFSLADEQLFRHCRSIIQSTSGFVHFLWKLGSNTFLIECHRLHWRGLNSQRHSVHFTKQLMPVFTD